MEIVTIEKRTFELWKQRFENFVGRGVWMRSVCLYAGSVTSGWITARPAVC